jgi:hypothetical protein
MQGAYCIDCGIETYQEDRHCILCRTGITQLYDELISLLTVNKIWVMHRKLKGGSMFKGDSVPISSDKETKTEIQRGKIWKDFTITKVCDTCGKEYHPRKNGFQYTSRFCSRECYKKTNNRLTF